MTLLRAIFRRPPYSAWNPPGGGHIRKTCPSPPQKSTYPCALGPGGCSGAVQRYDVVDTSTPVLRIGLGIERLCQAHRESLSGSHRELIPLPPE